MQIGEIKHEATNFCIVCSTPRKVYIYYLYIIYEHYIYAKNSNAVSKKKQIISMPMKKNNHRVLVFGVVPNLFEQIFHNAGASHLSVRPFITSNSLTHLVASKSFILFLSFAASFPATPSKIHSHPFSHSLLASQSSILPFFHSVQLHFWSNSFMIFSTHGPVQIALQGRHLTPLSGPLLVIDATGTPYLLQVNA